MDSSKLDRIVAGTGEAVAENTLDGAEKAVLEKMGQSLGPVSQVGR
jgi:hypothetical protein